MSYKKLYFDKLASFGRLLGKNKKEQNINKSVSNSSMESSVAKNTKLNTSGKSKKNMPEKKNYNDRENVNKNEKESNINISSNDSNNMQSLGKNFQEFMELTSVDSIYEENNVALVDLNTIFIAETYLKTLPDYLPNELKRKAVLDIILSSGLSADKLLKDGEERKKVLNNFLQRFSQTTEKIIRDYENEILKLSESIQANKKSIIERKELQEEQIAIINYEIQRLQRIINFLQGECS
ncbi:MAG TPA: hypothetical protein GXZ70_04370 [Clostridiales bacterium]|nr:hypothetical protein [Clostridiales bacterium]